MRAIKQELLPVLLGVVLGVTALVAYQGMAAAAPNTIVTQPAEQSVEHKIQAIQMQSVASPRRPTLAKQPRWVF